MKDGRPVSRTLVMQPLPGIGDAVWHLPHIRAIARASPEGRVCLLTRPRSLADRLFAADPAVDRVLWLHRGKGRHDGLLGFLRLAGELRRHSFQRVWILHRSARYAQIAWAAGIGERHGFGIGSQHLFLNQPGRLPAQLATAHPTERATRLMALKGIEMRAEDGLLTLSAEAGQRVSDRFGHLAAPWIGLGIGSSEAFKQWGAANFTALADLLCAPKARSLILLGGPGEAEMGRAIQAQAQAGGVELHSAIGLEIEESAALLARCRLYIGNDSGALSLAAAVGTEAIGLFGNSRPLTHSPLLHTLEPGQAGAGMAGITPRQVAEAVRALGIA